MSTKKSDSKPRKIDAELIAAVLAGDVKKAEDALERGANADVRYNKIPLSIVAINTGYYGVSELLILKVTDVNARDTEDNTLLMHAAQNGNLRLVKLLASKGAVIDAQNKKGETALMLAMSGTFVGKREVVEFLLEKGASYSIRNKEGKNAEDLAVDQSAYGSRHMVDLIHRRMFRDVFRGIEEVKIAQGAMKEKHILLPRRTPVM